MLWEEPEAAHEDPCEAEGIAKRCLNILNVKEMLETVATHRGGPARVEDHARKEHATELVKSKSRHPEREL